MLSSQCLTLLVLSGEVMPEVRQDLEACGIHLATYEKGMARPQVDGFLVTKPMDMDGLESGDIRIAKTPRLLLVYGAEIPYGWADTLVPPFADNGKWEVVRMMLVSGQERAWIGGEPNSKWVRCLCRQLAQHQLLSMVCDRREVDEAIRQLPRYLSWKEQFYLELGEVCDTKGISLRRVARALGMDKRIGQGWLYPERLDQSLIREWITRECQQVMQKANVLRVALWGPLSMWIQMPPGWLADKEVRLYTNSDEPFPNESFPRWSICPTWTKALENADLLVIGQMDDVIGQLPLQELVRCMGQAIVVDAAGCFPLQEAQSNLNGYRAIGENTNVWE